MYKCIKSFGKMVEGEELAIVRTYEYRVGVDKAHFCYVYGIEKPLRKIRTATLHDEDFKNLIEI